MSEADNPAWTKARAECSRLLNVHILEMCDQLKDARKAHRDGHAPDRSDEFRWKIEALEALRANLQTMRPGDMVRGEYAPEHDR